MALQINNLYYAYPNKRAIDVIADFNIDISDGGIYGLLGPNGAGKSTLLYLIAGLLTPKAGEVILNDIDTRRRLPQTLSEIFLVPEELSLPAMSLMQYAKIYGPFYPHFSMADLEQHLLTFQIDGNVNMSQMSMGMRKKAYMCFALACNTQVLLMDEPTNGLDIPGKAAFRRFILSHRQPNQIIIISTHQARDINALVDHVLIVNNNQLLLSATTAEILTRLHFTLTNDAEAINQSLMAVPTTGGMNVCMPATLGHDTGDLDLELLFMLAMEKPMALYEALQPTEHE